MSTPVSQLTVAERMGSVRRAAGLTQEQMAVKLGVPLGTLRGYEQGKREISAAVVVALMQHWGTNPAWLLNGVGPQHCHPPARPIDDDQAEGIANKVLRQFRDRLGLELNPAQLPVMIEALKSAARRGADRAVANGPLT